jgi:uncharacterized protein
MPNHVILLPPSEGKATGGSRRGIPALSFPELDSARREVAAALSAVMRDETSARRLMGVKGSALEAAVAANTGIGTGPVLPAIERYTGVLYDNLDAGSLAGAARRRLRSGVVIFSGLWGLVRPADRIPDYKLKMDASLSPLGRLSTWWRPTLSAALADATRRRLVWDLLPQAHAAAWSDPDAACALRVTTAFVQERRAGGEVERSTVTHWSKALKGALARHLLEIDPVPPRADAIAAALAEFSHPEGYALEDLGTVTGDGHHLHATFVAPVT